MGFSRKRQNFGSVLLRLRLYSVYWWLVGWENWWSTHVRSRYPCDDNIQSYPSDLCALWRWIPCNGQNNRRLIRGKIVFPLNVYEKNFLRFWVKRITFPRVLHFRLYTLFGLNGLPRRSELDLRLSPLLECLLVPS